MPLPDVAIMFLMPAKPKQHAHLTKEKSIAKTEREVGAAWSEEQETSSGNDFSSTTIRQQV